MEMKEFVLYGLSYPIQLSPRDNFAERLYENCVTETKLTLLNSTSFPGSFRQRRQKRETLGTKVVLSYAYNERVKRLKNTF